MKKIKKLHLFLTLTIFILNLFFVACTAPTAQDSAQQNSAQQTPTPQGNFYTLSEAYAMHMLKSEDLQIIAEYHNNHLSCPTPLDSELENEIKEMWVKKFREDPNSLLPDFELHYITSVYYYGVFGKDSNCYAVFIDYRGILIPGDYRTYTIAINGITFNFYAKDLINALVIYKPIS